MPWIAAGMLASGIASGAMGAASSAGDRAAAQAAYAQSVKDYEAIGIPSIEAQQLVMQQYQSQGQWTPELAQAVKMGDSNMIGVSTDSGYTEAQKQALSKLQGIGDSGGMTLSDQGQLETQMGNLRAQERGSREAIMQNARQRGGYGSGTALAAQLMNQQNSTQQGHADTLNTQGQAQSRALQAIMGAGQLGTNLRTQQFGEQSQKAQAQDAINQWNAANEQATKMANANYANQASQYNLGNSQNLSNANTDMVNKQNAYNAALPQQYFNDQMALTAGKANARAGQASNLQQNARDTANMWSGIGSSVSQGLGAYGQYQNQQSKAATQFPGAQTMDMKAPRNAVNDDYFNQYAMT